MSLETTQTSNNTPTTQESWVDIQVGAVHLKMSISGSSPILKPREIDDGTLKELFDLAVGDQARQREAMYHVVPGLRSLLRLRLPELENPTKHTFKAIRAYQTYSGKFAQARTLGQDNSLWLVTELCKMASEVFGTDSLFGQFLDLVSRVPGWILVVGATFFSDLIKKLGVPSEVVLERSLTPEELAKVTDLAGADSINLESLGGQIIAALIASASPEVYEDIKRLVARVSEEVALELELAETLGEANPSDAWSLPSLSYEGVSKLHVLWVQNFANLPALPEARRVSLEEPTQEELAAFWAQGEVATYIPNEVHVTYHALEGCAGCDAFDPAWELLSNAYANFAFTRVLMKKDDLDLFAEIRNYPAVTIRGPFGTTTIEGLVCLQTTLHVALEGISRALKNAPLNLVPPSN